MKFHLAQPMPQERRPGGMTESGSVNMPASGAVKGVILLQDQMHEPDDFSLAVTHLESIVIPKLCQRKEEVGKLSPPCIARLGGYCFEGARAIVNLHVDGILLYMSK